MVFEYTAHRAAFFLQAPVKIQFRDTKIIFFVVFFDIFIFYALYESHVRWNLFIPATVEVDIKENNNDKGNFQVESKKCPV